MISPTAINVLITPGIPRWRRRILSATLPETPEYIQTRSASLTEITYRYSRMILHLHPADNSPRPRLFENSRLLECKLDRDSRCLALLPRISPLTFKGSFDARLIFLSELNMRFHVTACASGADQYPNSIYDGADRFYFSPPRLFMRCDNVYFPLISYENIVEIAWYDTQSNEKEVVCKLTF